jgi:hypothetical protein
VVYRAFNLWQTLFTGPGNIRLFKLFKMFTLYLISTETLWY